VPIEEEEESRQKAVTIGFLVNVYYTNMEGIRAEKAGVIIRTAVRTLHVYFVSRPTSIIIFRLPTLAANRQTLENCAILGYYAASSGNSLPTFRDNLSVSPQGSR
jgi:hypothetical protein